MKQFNESKSEKLLQDEQRVNHREHSRNGVLENWSNGVLIRNCGSGFITAIKETSFRNPSPTDIRNPGSPKYDWIPDLSFVSSGMTNSATCARFSKSHLVKKGG